MVRHGDERLVLDEARANGEAILCQALISNKMWGQFCTLNPLSLAKLACTKYILVFAFCVDNSLNDREIACVMTS
jgi:hypothetical protein